MTIIEKLNEKWPGTSNARIRGMLLLVNRKEEYEELFDLAYNAVQLQKQASEDTCAMDHGAFNPHGEGESLNFEDMISHIEAQPGGKDILAWARRVFEEDD